MSKDEALKLALEALEESLGYVEEEAENAQRLYGQYPTRQARIQGLKDDVRKHMKAITALREALAEQPAQPLPFGVGGGLVAIKTLLSRDPCVHANTAIQMIDAILAEHPAKRTWVGLTDEEEKIKCASPYDSRLCCVEETEAKLKEKNA